MTANLTQAAAAAQLLHAKGQTQLCVLRYALDCGFGHQLLRYASQHPVPQYHSQTSMTTS